MPTWLLVISALLVGVLIWRIGTAVLRSISGGPTSDAPEEAEDVEDLEVFLVCGECGTEFRVTRLGELQIPRHCGEPMRVVRRPASR